MTQTLFIVIVGFYAGSITLIPIGMALYSLRVVYLSGYHRFVFIEPDTKRQYAFMTRLKPNQPELELPHGNYVFDKNCVTYTGRYRIPTFNYIEGIANPYNVFDMDFSNVALSGDRKNIAKNVAMKQLLAAMMIGVVNPVNLMIGVIVIMLIGFIALGGYSYSEFATIKEAVGVQQR